MSDVANNTPGLPYSFDDWLRMGGWESVFDDLSRPGLRIGSGTTVATSHAQQHARRLFVVALHRRLPNITDSLVTPEGLDLVDKTSLAFYAHSEELSRQDSSVHSQSNPIALVQRAFDDLREHIGRWQKRYRLTEEWMYQAAELTLRISFKVRSEGRILNVPLIVSDLNADVHEGRNKHLAEIPAFPSKRLGHRHDLYAAPVYVDDLKWLFMQSKDTEELSGNFLSTFDPRAETIDQGLARILPSLEPRLRCALEVIAAEDRLLNKAQRVTTFRKTNAFDWLVRFQVLGESKVNIARTEAMNRAHVGREINEVAALMGLTLRGSKGGRPRRRHARTAKALR